MDEKLMDAVRSNNNTNGSKWKSISKLLGRTRIACQSRYSRIVHGKSKQNIIFPKKKPHRCNKSGTSQTIHNVN